MFAQPIPIVRPADSPAVDEQHLDHGDDIPDVLPLAFGKRFVQDYRARLLAQDARCIYCMCGLTEKTATAEHFIPQSKGGLHSPGNLWLCCARCNSERSSRDIMQWAAELREQASALKGRAKCIENALPPHGRIERRPRPVGRGRRDRLTMFNTAPVADVTTGASPTRLCDAYHDSYHENRPIPR